MHNTVLDNFKNNKGRGIYVYDDLEDKTTLVTKYATLVENKNRTEVIRMLTFANNLFSVESTNVKNIKISDVVGGEVSPKHLVIDILEADNIAHTEASLKAVESVFVLILISRKLIHLLDNSEFVILNEFKTIYTFNKYGCVFTEEEQKDYNALTDEINIALVKFPVDAFDGTNMKFENTFELMNAVLRGRTTKDKNGNFHKVDSKDIISIISKYHGWNKDLDKSIRLFNELDIAFKPSAIYDAADGLMRIFSNRANMLTNNAGKVNALIDILYAYKGKQILIFTNSTELTNAVIYRAETGVLDIKVKGYHNSLKKQAMIGEDGKPVVVKSGTNKGSIRMIGSTIIKRMNLEDFRNKSINVLIVSGAIPKGVDFKLDADMIILAGSKQPLAKSIHSESLKLYNKSIPVICLYNKYSNDDKKYNSLFYKIRSYVTMETMKDFTLK